MIKASHEVEGSSSRAFTSYNRKQRTVLMDEYLLKIGLKRKPISRDASCLFRAVSEQIFLSQGSHLQLRQACVQHLERNKTQFQGFVDGSYEEYLTRLSDTNEAASQIEISALSQMYKYDFIIYQYPDQEPENVTANGFDKFVYLCFCGRTHYDSVYPITYFDNFALCQSIVFELLVENVYTKSKTELSSSVNTLRLLRLSKDFKEEETESSDALIKEALKPPYNSLPSSMGYSEKNVTFFEKSCWSYRFPLKLDVVRALDPAEYRNTEYDMWMKVKRKQQHIDFALAVKMPYNIGDKCLVYLSMHSKPYVGHVQEVSPDFGPITVFVEELGYAAMHTLALTNVKPFEQGFCSEKQSGQLPPRGKLSKRILQRTRSKSNSQQHNSGSSRQDGSGSRLDQFFDAKLHVRYVIETKNQYQNLLTALQDNAESYNEPESIDRKGQRTNWSNYPSTARSLSYSDISGKYFDPSSGQVLVNDQQQQQRQRRNSEVWNEYKQDPVYEEEYQRCQSMENLNISKKSKSKRPMKLMQYGANGNSNLRVISASCENISTETSSWEDQQEEYNASSFSSPEVEGVIETTEQSTIMRDELPMSTQTPQEVSSPEDASGCYMQPVQMQPPNMQGHYVNPQPYINPSLYPTVPDGTYFPVPIIGSQVQLQPSGQIIHQPTAPAPCYNVVDSEGKDLNFFVQLGMMEYYRHTQIATTHQMANVPQQQPAQPNNPAPAVVTAPMPVCQQHYPPQVFYVLPPDYRTQTS